MKIQTKIDDLKKHIAATTAQAHADHDIRALAESIPSRPREEIIAALDRSIASRAAAVLAAEHLTHLPPARRDLAAKTAETALEVGRSAALLGQKYSGDTDYSVAWTGADEPSADTTCSRGERYSRQCKYSKTNADHVVTLAPSWAPLLVEHEDIRTISEQDGLPLIGIAPDGRCAWAKRTGKAITSEIGWIAFFGSTCYHSTVSKADAEKGLARKLAALRREWKDQHIRALDRVRSAKEERRARLVARLCSHVTATVSDARALGFCPSGIEQFQRQHGIGSSASLPALVRTGNPSAIRLALALARRVPRAQDQTAAA